MTGKTKHRFWIISALVCGIGIGLVANIFFSSFKGSSPPVVDERETDHEYSFISPLLSCGEGGFNHLRNDQVAQLERSLEEVVEKQKARGSVQDAGIYFRELKGGSWAGVNYDAEFTPASLLKVPLAMSVYAYAERNPGLLTKEIEVKGGSPGTTQDYSERALTPGRYRVEELIEAMLIHSDNTAALLLADIIGIDRMKDTYRSLGIAAPTVGMEYSTTVRTYASFFRILYNATYTGKESSEQILSVLSKSTFTDGLVAGVPKNIPISHKFGIRTIEGETAVELHDCGIVYVPAHPYLLCIMMRGNDFDRLAGAIKEVSQHVYNHTN
jgi:beta-lactamase class A